MYCTGSGSGRGARQVRHSVTDRVQSRTRLCAHRRNSSLPLRFQRDDVKKLRAFALIGWSGIETAILVRRKKGPTHARSAQNPVALVEIQPELGDGNTARRGINPRPC